MKAKLIWLLSGLVISVSGGSAWVFSRGTGRAALVQVATVEREDLQARVTANGKVQAQKKVDISATIAGQITHLAVKEGDRVAKGQFLLQIDPVNPRAVARSSEFSMQALLRDLDSAQATLIQARSDFRRAEENHKDHIISQADLEKAKTSLATSDSAVRALQRRVDQARATLEGAEDLLSKTTVRSPIDGLVTAKRVEEGEVAVVGVQNQPGTVLLTVSDMSVVEVEMEVDETSIPMVKERLEARVRIDAYPNRTFRGIVTEVGTSPLPRATSTEAIKFRVRARIEDPPEGIRPGLSAQAEILTGFRSQALVVPIQALVLSDVPGPSSIRKDQEGVYLVDGGSCRFQPLKTGLMGEMVVEVVEGLKGGETLITGPFRVLRTLRPGDAVKAERPQKSRTAL